MHDKIHDTPSSLLTADAAAGLRLAAQLAERLHTHLDSTGLHGPGGTHFGQHQLPSVAYTASVLFHSISMANQGWVK